MKLAAELCILFSRVRVSKSPSAPVLLSKLRLYCALCSYKDLDIRHMFCDKRSVAAAMSAILAEPQAYLPPNLAPGYEALLHVYFVVFGVSGTPSPLFIECLADSPLGMDYGFCERVSRRTQDHLAEETHYWISSLRHLKVNQVLSYCYNGLGLTLSTDCLPL